MSETRMALVGATGLIGRALIERCVAMPRFRIGAIARRRIDLPKGARMEMFVADPIHWTEIIASLEPNMVVCALGTTWQKAGKNEAKFRAVDEALVLDVARAAKAAGARQFIFISSTAADPGSKHVYLRVKGEVERELMKMRFTRLDILRPGMLRGQRIDDARPAERAMMLASPILDLFLHGKYRAMRSINAAVLVDAILGLSFEKSGGRFVHEHDALIRHARRFGE
jgi:uncharacterized protein YbjT (DUF2867 family)